MQLAMLTKHLHEVAQANPAAHRAFRKRLRELPLSAYLGVRCEILVAASLSRRGISFTHEPPDGPDFLVDDGSGVGIECTSVRVTRRKPDRNLGYKLEAALRSKDKKEYARQNVALVIERRMIDRHLSDDEFNAASDLARAALSRTRFGAAVLCSLFRNDDDDVPTLSSPM